MNSHTSYIAKLIFIPVLLTGSIISAIYIINESWITEKKYILAPMITLLVLGIYYFYMIKEHKAMKKYWNDKKG